MLPSWKHDNVKLALSEEIAAGSLPCSAQCSKAELKKSNFKFGWSSFQCLFFIFEHFWFEVLLKYSLYDCIHLIFTNIIVWTSSGTSCNATVVENIYTLCLNAGVSDNNLYDPDVVFIFCDSNAPLWIFFTENMFFHSLHPEQLLVCSKCILFAVNQYCHGNICTSPPSSPSVCLPYALLALTRTKQGPHGI